MLEKQIVLFFLDLNSDYALEISVLVCFISEAKKVCGR